MTQDFPIQISAKKIKRAQECIAMAAAFIEGLADNKEGNNKQFLALMRETANDLN